MRFVEFGQYHINPEKVVYVQRLANVTRIFLEGAFTIDVPDSDRTVVYQLVEREPWEVR